MIDSNGRKIPVRVGLEEFIDCYIKHWSLKNRVLDVAQELDMTPSSIMARRKRLSKLGVNLPSLQRKVHRNRHNDKLKAKAALKAALDKYKKKGGDD